jgi:phage gp46-like protein
VGVVVWAGWWGGFFPSRVGAYVPYIHQQSLSELRERGQLGELDVELRWMVDLCRRLRLAHGSHRTYGGHQGQFLAFCDAFELDPLCLTEEELCMVGVYFSMGHTVSSLDSFMSAVQSLYNDAGAGELPRTAKFLLFKRGIKRLLGPADEVVPTKALGVEELGDILGSLDQAVPEDVRFGAQLTVAFFLALRTEDHTDGRLRWGDIFPQPDGSVEFLLPPGKSVRRFRRVAISAKQGLLNALTWLRKLAAVTPAWARQGDMPVFVSFGKETAGGRPYPLSRSKFIARFKRAVVEVLKCSPVLYAGYSLRRGGVTEMLMSDVPLPMIKRHVGWTPGSDAICSYYDHAGRLQMRMPTAAMGERGRVSYHGYIADGANVSVDDTLAQ